MRGRKRLPDHLKVVKGTDQRCRMNPDAPVADKSLPVAPDHLSARGAELFRQLVVIISGMGIASASDVHALTILAQVLEDIEILTVVIEDSGRFFVSSVEYDGEGRITSQQIKAHPAVAQRDSARRHAQSLLSEFGLTPAARSKVSATTAKEKNPFAALG